MARILVVDDQRLERILLEALLVRAGYEIVSACDGAEALQACETVAIDIVVTDLQMPNVDGLELISRLTVTSPSLPVIVVSGAGVGELQKARVLGATATFNKPVDPKELVGAITRALAEGEGRDVG